MERNQVYIGNNIDVLKTFPDNSIDSIVTDPPYGLGKEPDAVALLQDWITTGYHEVKGKGFMGKEWDAFVPQPIFWKECYRVLKHGGHVLSFAGTRTYDWMVLGLRLAGFEIRDQLAWIYGSGFPKSTNVSIQIDKKLGAMGHRGKASQAFVVGTQRAEDGKELEKSIEVEPHKGITDQAKEWQGWGTALKPALEPIVMARKPLDGTVADNVLKHGVGGINIDGCRVGDEEIENGRENRSLANSTSYHNKLKPTDKKTVKGRFPANVIHDGSDEVVALFPETAPSSGNIYIDNKEKTTKFGQIKTGSRLTTYDDNGGSAARFFYTAKASQSERNWGLDGFDEKIVNDGRDVNLASGNMPQNRSNNARKNIHPTVKPIDLMRYLVRLVTPKGGVCLDPFLGSGTTAVAAKAEKFDYIGIELSPEYAEIAKARIKAEVVQYDIFDVLEDYDE
jgi:site-specific DNA-methyltransferase (adenine-specific)